MAADLRSLQPDCRLLPEFEQVGGDANGMIEMITGLVYRILLHQIVGAELNAALFIGLPDTGRQQGGVIVFLPPSGKGIMP